MAVRLHPGKLGLLSTRLATFFIQSDPGPIFFTKNHNTAIIPYILSYASSFIFNCSKYGSFGKGINLGSLTLFQMREW